MGINGHIREKAERRVQRWAARWQRGEAAFLADPERKQEAISHWQQAYQRRRKMLEFVGPVVEEKTHSALLTRQYLNFGCALERLQNRDSGLCLAAGAELLVNQWESKGLSRPVLEEISRRVLGYVPMIWLKEHDLP